MADQPPNPNPTPTPTPASASVLPTSQDVVKSGPVSGVVRKLETRISILEDAKKQLEIQNKELSDKFSLLKGIPSTTPGKSILQELDEFVFGKPTPPKV
jgi:hypothetical protein